MALGLNITLPYYKREDIREAIISSAKDCEVSSRYNDKFGKRPDTLMFPGDILELVRQGATSFHASEERWQNPLQLNTGMRKKELDDLRIGWDLVLDIDCPFWELSKIITWLFVKALKDFNIKSISIKFSGNKGFHIGVPFEAFPEEINSKKTKDLFPALPKAIATYLLDYISNNLIEVKKDNSIVFGSKFRYSLDKLKEITSKKTGDFTKKYCSECNSLIKKKEKKETEFICPKCASSIKNNNEEFIKCKKCDILMEKIETKHSLCKCGSNSFKRKFNPLSIIEVDTILLSSRHLYRMPYSMHEKSGLVSRPFNPEKIMNFEKKHGNPENLKVSKWKFLDRENAVFEEMKDLSLKSLEFIESKEEIKITDERKEINFEEIGEVPETLFPPCIENIKKGLLDGKKRSLFVLTNFLTCVGWNHEKTKEFLDEWNKNNPEPLREVNILGQVRYHKAQKKRILPPNCSNKMYYKDLGICNPDNLCSKIKNPVNYAIRKGRYLNKTNKSKKKEKSPKKEPEKTTPKE